MKKKLIAEFSGSAMLLISVVGSGIMGESLANGNTAIALLANAIATGCMLYCIITIFGPISGAHFNPVVSVAFCIRREISIFCAILYILMQISGGIIGVWITHLMFDQTILQISQTNRSGINLWCSEVFATFGLILVIFGSLFHSPKVIPAIVGIYITGAYWFTSSTSFANPAVSIARALTDTFAGISPMNAPSFILSQFIGLFLSMFLIHFLFSKPNKKT